MRLFHFYRIEDMSGVSGVGPVVEGVEFTNGWCALRWISIHSSMCFYQSMEEVRAIHGHGGKTEIVMHDFEPITKRKSKEGSQTFDLLLQIIEEASHLTVMAEDFPKETLQSLQSIQRIRHHIEDLEKSIHAKIVKSA